MVFRSMGMVEMEAGRFGGGLSGGKAWEVATYVQVEARVPTRVADGFLYTTRLLLSLPP
jgi:hypothetical protein